MDSKADFFNFTTSYFDLPEKFYRKVSFLPVPQPQMVLWNQALAENIDLNLEDCVGLTEVLVGNKLAQGSEPFSQSYAGHQFGHFTMLGDGRAAVLGEHVTKNGIRFDIQLKGSGRTPFSRGGDGKATYKAMLREYLVSESMHFLGIASSRSLAVVKTGEMIQREAAQEGAVLTRVMKSHLRVGTFEFARYFGDSEDIESLLNYTIQRLYPELINAENKALALLEKVMQVQIELVVDWMRVGFIHGVMNTDNTSISGETFDYGPCAFMGIYNPQTVFSSIDKTGRYAFDNQPKILKWNLARLAEALLPLMDENQETAIQNAIEKINSFDIQFSSLWYTMMLAKLGISDIQEGDTALVDEFLQLLEQYQIDYTNAFTFIRNPIYFEGTAFKLPAAFNEWMKNWQNRMAKEERAFELMQKVNPILIPRNYFVEQALTEAENGDLSYFNQLQIALKTPYLFKNHSKSYLIAPDSFDSNYCTFCGT